MPETLIRTEGQELDYAVGRYIVIVDEDDVFFLFHEDYCKCMQECTAATFRIFIAQIKAPNYNKLTDNKRVYDKTKVERLPKFFDFLFFSHNFKCHPLTLGKCRTLEVQESNGEPKDITNMEVGSARPGE